MTEIEVRTSARKLKRDMNRAMRKSFLKALTEPITNSDDSYKRIEEKAIEGGDIPSVELKKQILIYVNEVRKEFQIVDFAEGLSKSDMEELFSEYGDEKSSHFEMGRGLFGQGLLDLLFSRDKGGYVHSFNDNKYCSAQFKWKKNKDGKERRVIRLPNSPLKITNDLRDRFHIPYGNGTCVIFKFTEADRFPNEDEIIEGLSNFFMLRFINSDPNREVKVIFLTKEGNTKSEHKLNYVFPEGEFVDEFETSMTYRPFSPIEIEAKLFKNKEPLSQVEAGDNREGGLIVYDENFRILDLTLFRYDDNPYATKFYGKLKLTGIYKIIREKLKEDEEILSETRDGFVKSHHFHVKLKQIIEKWLKPIIEEEKNNEPSKLNLSDNTIKKHKEAFTKLNEIYEKLNENISNLGKDPGIGSRKPENGIEFDRKNTTIEEKKDYSIRLRVDKEIIPPGNTVNLEINNETISVSPSVLTVDESFSKENIFSQEIIVYGNEKNQNGIIRAESNSKSTEVQVEVVEEELFFPSNPLEFNPTIYHSEPGKTRTIFLYIDISKIPIGSTIQLNSTNENIKLESNEIIMEFNYIQKNNVGKIEIHYIGYGIGQKGKISASFNEYSAESCIEIKPKKQKRTSGIFTDWDYQPMNISFQTWHDPDTGIITINSNHPINIAYFGKSREEALRSVEIYPHCQMLLAELIISECLAASVHPAYMNNKLDIRFVGDPFTDVYRYIQDKKREIGKEIFDLFVKKSTLNKMESILLEENIEI